MRNNKGISIVEIVVAVALLSIVIVFLFNIFVVVREEDSKAEERANMLISQAVITKAIQDDFIDFGLIGVGACTNSELINATGMPRPLPATAIGNSNSIFCIKFQYSTRAGSAPRNVGYLLHYSYQHRTNTPGTTDGVRHVVGYVRGANRVIRAVTGAPDTTAWGQLGRSCFNNYCAIRVDLPIKDSMGDDFGIYLSYVYPHQSGNVNTTNFPTTGLTFSFPSSTGNIASSHYRFQVNQIS